MNLDKLKDNYKENFYYDYIFMSFLVFCIFAPIFLYQIFFNFNEFLSLLGYFFNGFIDGFFYAFVSK